jgi:hypothetical protein
MLRFKQGHGGSGFSGLGRHCRLAQTWVERTAELKEIITVKACEFISPGIVFGDNSYYVLRYWKYIP